MDHLQSNRLLSISARYYRITYTNVSSSTPQNLHFGSFSSPSLIVLSQSIVPSDNHCRDFCTFSAQFEYFCTHASIFVSLMKVLAVRHSWAFLHASECFLTIHLSNSLLIMTLHIPTTGSDPIRASLLAYLASLYVILFPFIPVWLGSQNRFSKRVSTNRFKVR